MLIPFRAAGTDQWYWSPCTSAARRRSRGHTDEYFTIRFFPTDTDLHILCVCGAGSPRLPLNDTLMAKAEQMLRPNQDKWEPFLACCKVNMVIKLSYLEKLPVEWRELADFRLVRGNCLGLVISKFLLLYSAISTLRATYSASLHNNLHSTTYIQKLQCVTEQHWHVTSSFYNLIVWVN